MLKYIDHPEKVQLEIMKKTLLVALLPLLSSLIHDRTIFLGLSFGLVISFLLFRLNLINIRRAVDMQKARASSFIRNRYFVEYVISFVGLAVAYQSSSLNVWAAAAGLFLLKITVLGWVILELIKKAWQDKLESLQ